MTTALHHRADRRDRPVTASPIRRWVLATLAALVLGCLAAGAAQAHAELVEADPADGAELATPPTTITLTFSERLDPAKSSFKLLGPDGAEIGVGSATANRVMTLDGLTLAAGAYRIQWTSASAADGDIERGTLAFTVLAPAASASAAPPSAAASAPPSASVGPAGAPPSSVAPVPTPAPGADASPAASTGDVLVPILVGLLVVAGVGAFVLRRSRGL